MVKLKKGPVAEAKKGDQDITAIKNAGVSGARATPGRRPISKADLKKSAKARLALATGQVEDDMDKRRKERDLRTLYVRFKTAADKLPKGEESIRGIHPDVQQIRVLRHGKKSDKQRVKFCFLEFSSEETCESAHNSLQSASFSGGQLYVDFVGSKARNKVKEPFKATSKKRMPINPTRLLVAGLPKSVAGNSNKVRKFFKKSVKVEIPKRSLEKSGGSFGFVHFDTPGDAKAAFDAASNLVVDGKKVTVVYAKKEKREVFQKKEPKKRPAPKEDAKKENAKRSKKEEVEEKEGDTSSDEGGAEEEDAQEKGSDDDAESVEEVEEESSEEDGKEEEEEEQEGDASDDDESSDHDEASDVENDEESDDDDGGDGEASEEEGDDDEGSDEDEDDSDDEEVENDEESEDDDSD